MVSPLSYRYPTAIAHCRTVVAVLGECMIALDVPDANIECSLHGQFVNVLLFAQHAHTYQMCA